MQKWLASGCCTVGTMIGLLSYVQGLEGLEGHCRHVVKMANERCKSGWPVALELLVQQLAYYPKFKGSKGCHRRYVVKMAKESCYSGWPAAVAQLVQLLAYYPKFKSLKTAAAGAL